MMELKIRVRAKTDADQYRIISVSNDGSLVTCDCDGFIDGFCSHIDAVLIAQERGMILEEDFKIAEIATVAVAGKITVPSEWKGSWRRNLKWRGLSSRGSVYRRTRDENKPLVCFTGKLSKPRASLIEEAQNFGWETTDSPNSNTDLLVAENPMSNSSKIKMARKNKTIIVSEAEWEILIHQ